MISSLITFLIASIIIWHLREVFNEWKDAFLYTRDSIHPVYSKGIIMETFMEIRNISKKWRRLASTNAEQTPNLKATQEDVMNRWTQLEKKYNYRIQANLDVKNGKLTLNEFLDKEDIDIMN